MTIQAIVAASERDLASDVIGGSAWPVDPARFGAGQDVSDALARILDGADTSYRE